MNETEDFTLYYNLKQFLLKSTLSIELITYEYFEALKNLSTSQIKDL